MKKIISIMLVAVMMITLVACGKSPKNVDSDVVKTQEGKNSTNVESSDQINFDKKIDLSIFTWGPKDILEGDPVVETINEKFNVNLKIQRILAKEYKQNLELKIAANDLPDLFRYQSSAVQMYTTLQEDGYLANFTEYAKKYNLSGIQSVINDPEAARFSEEDGFYQLPTNKGGADAGIVVRKDWLDKLNMKMPETYEEYYEMLKAFKDNNLGGADGIPHTGYDVNDLTFLTKDLMSGYVGANDWKKVGEEWQSTKIIPEFQEGLKYWKRLYNEGLFDQEYFTLNENQANSKIISGKSGAMLTLVSNRYETLQKSLKENDPEAELDIITPNLKGPAGHVYLTPTGYSDPVVIIKKGKTEETISRAMAVMDFLRSEEGIDLTQNGIEGVHYTIEGDKKVYNDTYKDQFISGIGHMLAMLTDYRSAREVLEGPVSNYFKENEQYAVINPAEGFTNDVFQEASISVEDVYSQWIIEFMVGKKDIDNDWDDYVKALQKAGLNQMTEEVNNYLNSK